MKKSQLRDMSIAELEANLQDNMTALENLRFQKSTAAVGKPVENQTGSSGNRPDKNRFA